jgi:hypothetical protein
LVLAGVTAVLVDLANAELDTGVVFGFDDAVGRAAFAGDVASKNNMSDLSPSQDFLVVSQGKTNVSTIARRAVLTDRQSLPFRSPWLLAGKSEVSRVFERENSASEQLSERVGRERVSPNVVDKPSAVWKMWEFGKIAATWALAVKSWQLLPLLAPY